MFPAVSVHDWRDDVISAGLVLLILLTGKPLPWMHLSDDIKALVAAQKQSLNNVRASFPAVPKHWLPVIDLFITGAEHHVLRSALNALKLRPRSRSRKE